MLDFRKLAITAILADGKVDDGEAKMLARELKGDDGKYHRDALKFLIELRGTAHKKKKEVTEAFEKFFFKVITDHVLKDGSISKGETEWIRANLLADGKIDDREWAFMQTIHKKAERRHPEFDKLYAEFEAKHAKSKK